MQFCLEASRKNEITILFPAKALEFPADDQAIFGLLTLYMRSLGFTLKMFLQVFS